VRWTGRCNGCGEWNTLVERALPTRPTAGVSPAPTRAGDLPVGGSAICRMSFGGAQVGQSPEPPVLLSSVGPNSCEPVPTGIDELDRVLSGGFVPGSVTLIGGEPGIGKSTLLLQAAASVALRGSRTLLVAAEESVEQVRRRAERLGALVGDCYIAGTGDLQTALEATGTLQPALVVVDSIQTISDPTVSSQLGSISQVRECAQALAHYAKATGTSTVLVGHVTKEGALAGPRALEHLVDTVLSFEGDRHHSLRHLSATKHRYGTTGEIGLFEMGESGLVGLADPSSVLIGDRRRGVAGSVVTPVVEGRRPLLVEVQALADSTRASSPKRVVQGILPARLALLLAVLEQSAIVSVGGADVFVSTVGGIKVSEPATDLAVALAIVSAVSGVPISEEVVAFGEVGLRGEVRQAPASARRLAEAARIGFTRAIVPVSTPQPAGIMQVVHVATLSEAVSALGLTTPRPSTDRRSSSVRRGEAPVATTGFGSRGGADSGRQPRRSEAVRRAGQAQTRPTSRPGLTVVRS
jgi:DNA repair protein RadA/Sms